MPKFDFEQFFSDGSELEKFKLDIREQITGIPQPKEKEYRIENTIVTVVLTDNPVEIVSTMGFDGDSLSKETISVLERINHMIGPGAKVTPAKFDNAIEETIYDPALEDFFNASTEDIKMCVNE